MLGYFTVIQLLNKVLLLFGYSIKKAIRTMDGFCSLTWARTRDLVINSHSL
jgi:hypothetical protein